MSVLDVDRPWLILAAFVVGTLATTRITKLITEEDWPPAKWFREWFCCKVPAKWEDVVTCPWCASPYLTFVNVTWAWMTGLHWLVAQAWWYCNVIAAVAWLCGFLTVRDIPEDMRE